MHLSPKEIGGATVLRSFQFGDRLLKRGETLTREEVLGMPATNRRCLADNGKLDIVPLREPAGGRRFVVHMGGGQFDVVEGRKLNDTPLTKEEALELAGATAKRKKRSEH